MELSQKYEDMPMKGAERKMLSSDLSDSSGYRMLKTWCGCFGGNLWRRFPSNTSCCQGQTAVETVEYSLILWREQQSFFNRIVNSRHNRSLGFVRNQCVWPR